MRMVGERVFFSRRPDSDAERREDEDTARLVTRVQSGDQEGFATLYSRYFDRVYGYLRLVLRDHHEAEDATQQVFLKVLEGLPRYERRRQPFRAWLFVVVRNHAIQLLRKEEELALEPDEIAGHAERAVTDEELDPAILRWISDRDFAFLVERLPALQRQVLALRYMLDLSHDQIAAVLDRRAGAVRALHHRALRTLEARLVRLGRAPREVSGGDARMVTWPKRAPVLRARKYSLWK
jgi:RNA polymerase sigma-70 factor (ECF subfamily)